MSKKLNKQIDYIQAGLKQDQKDNPNRDIKEFTELVNLIHDQYKDKTTNKVKNEDTVSIEEVDVAVGIDGNKVWNRYSKTR